MTPTTTSPPLPDAVRVRPAPLAGTLRVPGDKSLSHRALIVGALVGRPVTVRGLAASADVAATARALQTLGATVDLRRDDVGLAGTVSGPLHEATDVLDCGNSGTALRLLAGVCAGIDGLAVLTGDGSLRRRPVDRVAVPLATMGARVDARAGRLPPLVVRGGGLRPTTYDSPVASAQVKSAVLLAAVTAGVPAEVTSPLRSRDHTERLLAHLGGEAAVEMLPDGRERARVRPATLTAGDIDVLGDPSSAAFWLVAAAAGAGDVTVEGICLNPTRLGAVNVLREMGAAIDVAESGVVSGEPAGSVSVRPTPLAGAVVAGVATVDAIDELPVLALAGALGGGLEVRDAAELRVKESDRIAGLAQLFAALGLVLEQRPDGFVVPGGQRPAGGTVDPGGDHRIAMTAAVAGTLADAPVEVADFGCVATSYPSFLDDLVRLGGNVEALPARPAP